MTNDQASSLLFPNTLQSTENSKSEVVRPLVKFQPSVWGDYFLEYACDNELIDDQTKQVEELKEEVRKMLIDAKSTPLQKMNLIDEVIRLGVGYHFEMEIEKELGQLNHTQFLNNDGDLYSVSLHFRLLRQHGHNVSCDVFSKFKNDKGMFKTSLVADIQGMLCLYEASYLGVHGEDILDEALKFTIDHLKSYISTTNVDSLLARQVEHALKQSYHYGMPRLETISFISFYQKREHRDEALLKFAKLDFYLVRCLHLKELSEVTKWWMNHEFMKNLPYVRDRLVELYFWTLGLYFEPKYSAARVIETKFTCLISLVDDTYDAYGTFEELQLFTDLFQRWDINTIDQLPDYMKFLYRSILDFFDETKKDLIEEGRSYRLDYLKEAVKGSVRAYFAEAKWCHQGYVPSTQEYLDVGMHSTCYDTLIIAALLGVGDTVTKKVFDWLNGKPQLIVACMLICRVMDDMRSHEFERERNHVVSVVECYMKEFGVSDEEACFELEKMLDKWWKDTNEGILHGSAVVPMEVVTRILNYNRMMVVIYKDMNGYTFPQFTLKKLISSLFVDPLPV
ncbi:hypothetical protein GIB67_033771 [Kingdonia uniflora]|uniref:Uncharacterized protein n=1 Tax=Kingdonia uniflora TaxID=39325 RepID=A0A7J7P468_9MAGN|nr:hypothetical protein GIB67_033771 [Kingdonia uniflora]